MISKYVAVMPQTLSLAPPQCDQIRMCTKAQMGASILTRDVGAGEKMTTGYARKPGMTFALRC